MNNPLPVRKPLRLKNYNYSQPGFYYITICTKDKENLLWECRGDHWPSADNKHILTSIGKIVEKAVNNILEKYSTVYVDKYTIMPNHIHLIIVIKSNENGRPLAAPTLSTIINQFKGYVSKQAGKIIWQKG